MAYCTECGAKIKNNETFCTNCGKKIKHLETKKETKKSENKKPYSSHLRLFLIILSLILIAGCSSSSNIEINKFPYDYSNVFILTIDDLTLTEPYEYFITNQITSFLDDNEMPATFFAIPVNMDRYNFSSHFEIAQHGYEHINPLDGSYNEFSGLNKSNVHYRIREGKKILTELGYDIKGFRAPGWSLKESYLPFLRENFYYDSSYQIPIATQKDFIIIPIWLDLFDEESCNSHVCSAEELSKRKTRLLKLIETNDQQKEPIAVLSHFWQFEKAFKHNNSKEYLQEFFEYINSKDYWKTTMYNYSVWKRQISNLSYETREDEESVNLIFSSYLKGLTFTIKSSKNIQSNYYILCKENDSKQKCTIQ